jgi:hypothetical protein
MLRPVSQKVNAFGGRRSFSTYDFANKIIERSHVAVFVEEVVVLPVRHDDCMRWKH